eukprot:524359-Pyramimonas_sp.AAC.1
MVVLTLGWMNMIRKTMPSAPHPPASQPETYATDEQHEPGGCGLGTQTEVETADIRVLVDCIRKAPKTDEQPRVQKFQAKDAKEAH